jgi:starvation-inducible DNA-binding protein
MIIEDCRRQSAHLAEEDPGTADMLVGNVLRTNELETWFLAEHLVDSRFSEPQE